MPESDSELVLFARATSRVLGWIYFFCWSGSFYPQPISNYKRKSTLGLAIDFPTLNVLGFIAYTISTTAFYRSSTIQSQYAYRHPESPETTVRFNDWLFAAHGAVMCVIIYSQFFPSIWGFKVGSRQTASRAVLGIFWGCIVAILVTVLVVKIKGRNGGYDPSGWAWLDVIYTLGYVKLITVVVKYVPQAYLNWKRKSTEGWSIWYDIPYVKNRSLPPKNPMLLDFAGGITSLLQLCIDSSLQGSWEGVTGNPVKFGLSNITIAFDLIFFYQHYVMYRIPVKDEEEEAWENEQQQLLSQRIY